MAYTKSNTTNISFTGTSQSQTLSGKAKQILMSATAACYVSFDSTTVSSTNGFYVPADMQYIFNVLYSAQVAVIQKTGAGTLSIMELGDSVGEMAVTYTGTYTGDTNLKGEVTDSYTGDADLKGEVASTFTGDAHMAEIKSATFTGDASLKVIIAATFTSDANLKSEVTNTFTCDANMKETVHPFCFNGDAKLVVF